MDHLDRNKIFYPWLIETAFWFLKHLLVERFLYKRANVMPACPANNTASTDTDSKQQEKEAKDSEPGQRFCAPRTIIENPSSVPNDSNCTPVSKLGTHVKALIDLFEIRASVNKSATAKAVIRAEQWTEEHYRKCVQEYNSLVKSLSDDSDLTTDFLIVLCRTPSTNENKQLGHVPPTTCAKGCSMSHVPDDTESEAKFEEDRSPLAMAGGDKDFSRGDDSAGSKSFERHILRELGKTLECPVCMELFRSPVLMCRQGHSVCGTCYHRVNSLKCPICNGGYSGCRNLVVEDAVSTLQSLCKCDCQKSLFFENDEDHHESYCKSRKVPCPVLDCSMEVVLDQIYCHILEDHVDVQLVSAVRHSQASTVKWLWNTTLLPGQPTRVVLDVKKYGVFLLQASTDEKKKTRSVWLQHLPVASQSSGFFCLVTLFSPSQLKKVAFQAVVNTEHFVCSEENACAILTDEITSTLECGIQFFRVTET